MILYSFPRLRSHAILYFPEYPAHTPLTRVIDGGEPSEFKSLFKSWRDKDATTKVSIYQDCKSSMLLKHYGIMSSTKKNQTCQY